MRHDGDELGELRKRGRELAADAPPLSEATRAAIAAILRGCVPAAGASAGECSGYPPGWTFDTKAAV